MAAIAFIGLGQMGSPMASNLLQQGHQLRVFDVNAEAVRHLVDKGATPAANPAQAAFRRKSRESRTHWQNAQPGR